MNRIADTLAQTPEQFLLIPNIGSQNTSWDTTNFAASRIDGAMLENVILDTVSPSDWQLELNRALALTSTGKIVIVEAYPAGDQGTATFQQQVAAGDQGTATFQQQVDYALASFLLIKGDYTYINLLGGRRNKGTGLYYYPQYDALQVLGPAVATLPGSVTAYQWAGVYRREFTNGFVVVNPSASPMSLSLPHEFNHLQCNGGGEVGAADVDPATFQYVGGSCTLSPVTGVTLAPWSGAVLFNAGVSIH
jgi:hypothetical protein